MGAQLHQTREAWLNYVAQCMGPMFEKLGAPLPAQLRIAIGFTSSGRHSRNIGESLDNQCSEDRHFEIFIRPDLSESKDLMPMQVAAICGWRETVELAMMDEDNIAGIVTARQWRTELLIRPAPAVGGAGRTRPQRWLGNDGRTGRRAGQALTIRISFAARTSCQPCNYFGARSKHPQNGGAVLSYRHKLRLKFK